MILAFCVSGFDSICHFFKGFARFLGWWKVLDFGEQEFVFPIFDINTIMIFIIKNDNQLNK